MSDSVTETKVQATPMTRAAFVKNGLMGLIAGSGLLGWMSAVSCASPQGSSEPITQNQTNSQRVPSNQKMESKTIVVAAGCFWCIEHNFKMLRGVLAAESGYAGGNLFPVTYEQVCTGQTGHAEVVKVTFDPKEIDEADLYRIFFTLHDPTQLNRQGPDSGTQYRSAIFFDSPEQKDLATKIMKEIVDAKLYRGKIVTTLEPLRNYVRAEEYHQDYFLKYEKATPQQRMMMNAGYCQVVVAPKVAAFRKKYADKLKKG